MVLRITSVSISVIWRLRTFKRSAIADGLPSGPRRLFPDRTDESDLSGVSVCHEQAVRALAGHRLPMRVTHFQLHSVLGEFHVSGEGQLFRNVSDDRIEISIDEGFETGSIAVSFAFR